MDYTLCPTILPAYARASYRGAYRPLMLAQSVLLPNRITALHFHPCAEIGLCLSGCGQTHVDRRVYSFSEGDLQYVPPGMAHLSAAAAQTQSCWQWLSFDPARLLKDGGVQDAEGLLAAAQAGFSGVFHPAEQPELAALIYRLRDLAQSGGSFFAQEAAFLTGELLIACARLGADTGRPAAEPDCSARLRPAITHIRAHYAEKEAMREEVIAGLCRMSVSHFRAVFRRETGQSVQAFIQQTRLAAAAYALRSTDARVLTVALESGFGQISCFNRIFSRTFGQTPTAYRAQYRP